MANLPVEAEYYTPDGCVDFPYIQVFDASALTDGVTYQNLIVQQDYDSDFLLRGILGVPYVVNPTLGATVGGIKLYNYSGSAAFADFVQPRSNQFTIVPEKPYPRNSAIKFDLRQVLRQNTPCPAAATIFYPQLAFQGVKRYRPGTPGYPPGRPALPTATDPGTYNVRMWTYTFTLNLSWFHWLPASTQAENARTFILDITDFDFELHYIRSVAFSTASGRAPAIPDILQMQLFDSTAKRPLMDVPVNITYLNNNYALFGNPVFPVPPLLYPVWSQLRFDIVSLLCNSDAAAPYTVQLQFVGAQRIPKIKAP